MNDEQLVEVIAEAIHQFGSGAKAPGHILAALRSAGFQVFRPEMEIWWCDKCSLGAEFRSDLACPHADQLPVYFRVPADSGGSG